ncbi:MAG: hypothetical protein WBX12_15060 [Candidatus Acidiferrales bacterium]
MRVWRPVRRLALHGAYLLFAFFLIASLARSEGSSFDLSGPRIEMTVTRGATTLPIANVPNLQSGDRIWIHPDFPDSQSVRYLLIVSFLRGSTNPPPDNWFTRAETWSKEMKEEGMVVTVPQGAQQVLLFLAPETGGGFSTLRSAVQSKPGAFVRASQDLNQAALDRSRLDKYLDEVQEISNTDPAALHDRSVLLARTLNVKVDQQCFDKPTEQQAPCLMQNSDQLVLDDGHTQSMVAALTSGPSSDLIGTLGSSPIVAGGGYSPYVGAVVDVARILSNLHTAEYQYIPALALSKHDDLNLRLNNPPSFRNPKSVLVVALPAVETAQLPPLRSVNRDQAFCLQQTSLVLPVEGAPLAFSTDVGHDFVLHLPEKSGASIDLPAKPDPARGGFLIDTHALESAQLAPEINGTLRGYWGFEAFDGPIFHIRTAHAATWTIPPADQSALIVGREDALHLNSECAVCVDQVTVKDERGKDLKATWKMLKPEELEVQVPLKDEPAGLDEISVKQFGLAKPDRLSLHAYAEAAHLDRFAINAGDRQGVLAGTRLDEVADFELSGVRFVPAKLSRAEQKDELLLSVPGGSPAALQPDESAVAHVALKDGRVLDLQTTVASPRPKITLESKSIQPASAPSPMRYGGADELPQGSRISFLLKSEIPEKFPLSEKIEVATVDESFDTFLTTADGSLMRQDSQSLLALFDPLKSFGPSAFGPLHIRAVDADGDKGDWIPLANLVRVPSLKEIRCPDAPDKPCALSGTNLFLIDSVASDSQFSHTVSVPIGFMDSTLTVPRPKGTLLYIKLRDDPGVVNTMVLPVLPD